MEEEKSIAKHSKKEIEIKQNLDKFANEIGSSIQIGDIFIEGDGGFRRVGAITKDGIAFMRRYYIDKPEEGDKDYENRDKYDDYGFEKYVYDKKYPMSDITEWDNLKSYHHKMIKIILKPNETLEQYEERALQEAIKVDSSKVDINSTEESTSTALALLNKEFLVHHKNQVEKMQQKFELLERVLDRKRNELSSIVRNFQEKIEKMKKIIGQIELYLGINEDIIQIQKGAKADKNMPIALRQQILYMDEETDVLLEQGGLDYKNIDEFDDWLLESKNYDKLIPEKKGVVIVRVRRTSKDYQTGNAMLEGFMNQANFYTYILIRNGDNIYRIWANIIIHDRLFPTQEEMDIIFKQSESESDYEKRQAEDKVFDYRQNLLMLQGLIDRTEIFYPLPKIISLCKPETYGDFVQFIRDDEPSLTDGHITYDKWKKDINSKIKRGTRILFAGFSWRDTEHKDYRYATYRYPHYVSNDPHKGVYSVFQIVPPSKYSYHGERIVCHFKPSEKVWHGWHQDESDRKRSVPFYLYHSDWCVLNYDLITIKDIDYFLNNRYDRRNYLEMLPVLYSIKQERLKEIEWERGFVESLRLKFNCNPDIVWKAVVWFKSKVIWKRPILKEEAKACRMIAGRVKRQLYELKVKRYPVCLACQKLILPPEGYEYCNCSERKPSKQKFSLLDKGAEIK